MLQKTYRKTPQKKAPISLVFGVKPKMQQTIARPVSCHGVGVHSANPATLTICPGAIDTGIVFVREDVSGEIAEIPARWHLVTDTTMCTKLTNGHGISIGTIEHVVAACVGMGITSARILVDGPEVPIMDGSSAVFVDMIQRVGLRSLKKSVRSIRVLKPVTITSGTSVAKLLPCHESKMTMKFDANGRLLPQQWSYTYYPDHDDFSSLLSEARTFGFYEDAQKLWSAGLAKGASLENTIVINHDGIMNEDGLRYDDELIRHKVLDAIGDLALAGVHIIGHFDGVNSGHALNNKLLRALFSDPTAWTVDQDAEHFIPSIHTMIAHNTAAFG